ncbi:cytochrome c biogenesis heme-transporting ATPase CcmA [Granulosicoccus antarcticus]|uniref:Cytochrome c biogenesis ATP-binding export protein CcmA n=1 Tax=Granulosicoccus antarcticus IMCC3135 TaxID=1192854 RepID=A0A2Z2NYE1_9GAMM|nr:cytochrome c biogenesis heme-transporting ATPase CcmA [Granulosicoccus antarcticus]ASJ74951.1 Cytochrome c biogenesis ATP-binding export protein CcmA [Granulosicoccus antarcticus IMCC3135]
MSALLTATGMTIWRGDNLLVDAVDVCVPPGSIVQIQGTNGSGKTTLLKALIGLAEYDEGEIYWRGQPVRKVRDELYASLLYLGHRAGISAGLTPLENLLALCPELSAGNQGLDGARDGARYRITQVLDELGIADRIDLPCAALSAGQQRRISLARLRLQSALLWVLDEPLTSLDANGYAWVKAQISRHVSAGGAVMFTTHQPLSFDPIPVQTILLSDNG